MPRPARRGPRDRVGEHALDVGMVVDGIVLVSGAEVEDPARAASEATACAKHLATRERAHEYELIWRGNVEVLAIHLLSLDHDRLRHARGDRVTRIHGPHQLTLAVFAPPQAAGRAE